MSILKYKPQIGQVFGYLTVLKFPHREGNITYSLCQCICGKKINCHSNELFRENLKSCGCMKNPKGKNSRIFKGYEEISGQYWNSLILGAEKRNLTFNVDIKDAWNVFLLQGKKCKISGFPIHFSTQYSKRKEQTASLDRIDSSKGYELDNIQWLHKSINELKSDFSDEELICFAKKIAYNTNRDCLIKLGPNYKDSRGEISMILESAECNSVSLIETKPLETRASHWHKLDYHYCYLVEGEIEYYERPVGSIDKPKLTIIKPGQLFFTPPHTEHEMFFTKPSKFFCYSKLSRKHENYEQDTIRLNYKLKNIYESFDITTNPF
jgi:hypothetical protein